MLASVQAFLSGLIDYAGLFPPAKLPLEQALRNYAEYRQGPDAWMLGRFIVPAARLAEVSQVGGELLAQGPPWRFSALGCGGGKTVAEYLDGVRADLEVIRAFRQRHPGRAIVDVFEVKIPEELLREPQVQLNQQFWASLNHLLCGGEADPLRVFCEATFGPLWESIVPPMPGVGVKVRCGGLEESAFPSAEKLAFALICCRNAGRPFKATAGLHHPLRHTDAQLKVKMHGFLNVFGAALLAYCHNNFQADQVREVIADEDGSHFTFDSRQFWWKDFSITFDQLWHGREKFATSFGSCSFDEPREDLRALGLLP
jgi:hypothetical protein